MPTKIEWAEETLNAVSGCTKISAGCANCYAEKMAKRLQAMGAPGYENGFDVTLHPGRFDEFVSWKKPRVVFWCSMGDLFHDDVPEAFIRDCLDLAWGRPEHTSIFLTKRAQRMGEVVSRWAQETKIKAIPYHLWFGVSTEDQQTVNDRVPHLLKVPGMKFLSAEPLLSGLDLSSYIGGAYFSANRNKAEEFYNVGIDAVIAGGESGIGARVCRSDWARSLRDQCKAAKVPFTWKQWGQWLPFDQLEVDQLSKPASFRNNGWAWSVGKHVAGRMLDGVLHNELPWGKTRGLLPHNEDDQ